MNYLITGITIIFLVLSFRCHALTQDQYLPINLQADDVLLNHKTDVGVYRGHVKLTQGTTTLEAQTLTTYLDKQKKLQEAIAIGTPAIYTTLPDNSKLLFVASGQTLYYYPQQHLLRSVGDAKATQGHDEYSGPALTYNIEKKFVFSPPSSAGRAKMVINPSQKQS